MPSFPRGSHRSGGRFVACVLTFLSAGLAGCAGDLASGPSDAGAHPHPTVGSSTPDGAVDGASDSAISGWTSVASSRLAGAQVSPCPDGAAHPNVCCTGGPGAPAVCNKDISAPFTACGSDALTFPDPAQCCPLDGGACGPVSASNDGASAGSCSFLCGPGGYSPGQLPPDSGLAGSPACTPSALSNNTPCLFCCDPSGGCPSNQVGCLAGGCAGGLANLQCDACPAGWSVPPNGQFDLCCRSGASGGTECFSQAAAIAFNSGSLGCVSDSATACTCTSVTGDGHVVVAHCDPSNSPACTCSLDGTSSGVIESFGGCGPLVTVRPLPDDGAPPPTASGAGDLLQQCPQAMP